ncbi:unnamed protein product [Cuscuta campestris]|uniref:Uncharacterized protein n=1 Tax=Cuscuta campestris TaxID=132261 RepID=A0A484KEA6_9ASTE|nr:unnamed protein product [Cuscuta campestris]
MSLILECSTPGFVLTSTTCSTICFADTLTEEAGETRRRVVAVAAPVLRSGEQSGLTEIIFSVNGNMMEAFYLMPDIYISGAAI